MIRNQRRTCKELHTHQWLDKPRLHAPSLANLKGRGKDIRGFWIKGGHTIRLALSPAFHQSSTKGMSDWKVENHDSSSARPDCQNYNYQDHCIRSHSVSAVYQQKTNMHKHHGLLDLSEEVRMSTFLGKSWLHIKGKEGIDGLSFYQRMKQNGLHAHQKPSRTS